MLFPVYLASMGVSAGIIGVFGRRMLAAAGYVPSFEAGLAAAVMIAGAFVLIQVAYGGLIQIIKPYTGKGPHLTESLSLLSALILVPYLLNVPIPWPHPKLAEMEPLIFLAAFGGVHVFFKLATLFAATQSPAGTQIRVIPYLIVGFAAFLLGQQGFSTWYASLTDIRDAVVTKAAPIRINDTYAWARPLNEGLQYPIEIHAGPNEHLTLRWSNRADASKPVEMMHVNFTFFGSADDTPLGTWKDALTLQEADWTTQRIPHDVIPPGTERLGVFWNVEEESEWIRQTGLRPTQTSGATVLLSGPYVHHNPAAFERPNLVIVLVEGLGADHMELFGYNRQTTPELTALSKRSSVWESSFTACPDTFSTAVTLMTGVSPLVHGSNDAVRTPVPSDLPTLPELMREAGYATAAFTEGEGSDGEDLVFGSGFERGFEVFNPAYEETSVTTKDGTPSPLVPTGSRGTLQRAADWIAKHREDERYLVFIRLRELRKPFALKRYGPGFIKPWENTPQPIDVYDTAIIHVDKQIGLFTERLREMGSFDDTCIVVTSPYGLDFSEPERGVWRRGGPGVPRLTEESIRVPLIMSLPEGIPRTRRALVSLNSVGHTLGSFAGVTLSPQSTARNLLDFEGDDKPITIMGDPMALSLRTQEWRYNWQSGYRAQSLEATGEDTSLALYNIADYQETKQNKDYTGREPSIARQYKKELSTYIESFVSIATANATPVSATAPGSTQP